MILRPNRREPRVLALAIERNVLLWVVADPFEIRSAGIETVRRNTIPTTVRRIVKREKPSVVAIERRALARTFARTAKTLGLAIVPGRFRRLPVKIATDLFPELPVACPTNRLALLATHALSVMLNAPDHPRLYAKSLRGRTAVRAA